MKPYWCAFCHDDCGYNTRATGASKLLCACCAFDDASVEAAMRASLAIKARRVGAVDLSRACPCLVCKTERAAALQSRGNQ